MTFIFMQLKSSSTKAFDSHHCRLHLPDCGHHHREILHRLPSLLYGECFVFSGNRLFAIDGAHLLQTNKVFSILNDSRGDIYNNTSVWLYRDPAWPEASSVNIFKNCILQSNLHSSEVCKNMKKCLGLSTNLKDNLKEKNIFSKSN